MSIHVQYFDMEQLSPQEVRSSLSSGQADSNRTQYNARVTKHQKVTVNIKMYTSVETEKSFLQQKLSIKKYSRHE